MGEKGGLPDSVLEVLLGRNLELAIMGVGAEWNAV